MQTEPPKRRWYQFSLRTLLIFTVVCAIAAGWLGKRVAQKRNERKAVAAVVKLGGMVLYDYEVLKSTKPPGPD
jgi:hypothetical protein